MPLAGFLSTGGYGYVLPCQVYGSENNRRCCSKKTGAGFYPEFKALVWILKEMDIGWTLS